MANTLAYYDTATITAVKSFIVQALVDIVRHFQPCLIINGKAEALGTRQASDIIRNFKTRQGSSGINTNLFVRSVSTEEMPL